MLEKTNLKRYVLLPIKSSSTVTEITLCADTMPDKSVQKPDDDIPHIQSVEPRDEPDNF